MAHSFAELKKKTVAELREIAKVTEHEAVKGYTQLNKEHLLAALCKALSIDAHKHIAHGEGTASLKNKIKELKKKREAALTAKDYTKLHIIRRKMHRLKHALRKPG
jgi:hypothetical protein